MTNISQNIHFYFTFILLTSISKNLFSRTNPASNPNITFKLEEQTLDQAGSTIYSVTIDKTLHLFSLQILICNLEIVGNLTIKWVNICKVFWIVPGCFPQGNLKTKNKKTEEEEGVLVYIEYTINVKNKMLKSWGLGG